MSASARAKTFRAAERAASWAVDHLLSKGASTLYDQYIYAKIPLHLSCKLTEMVGTAFEPFLGTYVSPKRISKINETLTHKIGVKEEKSSKFAKMQTDTLESTKQR